MEDYFDDVHISLDSVIDAGKNWLAINKAPCISLYSNDGFDVKSRIRRMLQMKRNKIVR